jgi:hypothetical protein
VEPRVRPHGSREAALVAVAREAESRNVDCAARRAFPHDGANGYRQRIRGPGAAHPRRGQRLLCSWASKRSSMRARRDSMAPMVAAVMVLWGCGPTIEQPRELVEHRIEPCRKWCAPTLSPESGSRPEDRLERTVDECVEDCAAAFPRSPCACCRDRVLDPPLEFRGWLLDQVDVPGSCFVRPLKW